MSHNLDQCLKELEAEARSLDQKQLGIVRKIGKQAMRDLIFKMAPVKTGFYASSFDLMVNDASKFRRRSSKRMKERKKNKMIGERQEQILKAIQRLNAVSEFSEIKRITIANNAPHAHLIEAGSSKQAPAGVFAVAERRLEMEFSEAFRELG